MSPGREAIDGDPSCEHADRDECARPRVDRGKDAPHRQLAQGTDRHFPASLRVGAVRIDPHDGAAQLLRGERALPVAVLLAVRHGQLRPGLAGLRHVVRPVPAARPVRDRDAAVPAGLPAHLLLLPPLVLPRLLGVPAGVWRGRAAQELLRRDQVPADLPEPAPLLLGRRRAHLDHQHLGRRPGVPTRRLRLRLRTGHDHHADQRDHALGLHHLVPLVPAHHRRAGSVVLAVSAAVQGVDAGLEAQRASTWSWPGPRWGR